MAGYLCLMPIGILFANGLLHPFLANRPMSAAYHYLMCLASFTIGHCKSPNPLQLNYAFGKTGICKGIFEF